MISMIRQNLKCGGGPITPTMLAKAAEITQEVEVIPWTMESVNDLTDHNSIIESLTDKKKYTYNTSYSKKEFHKMFSILSEYEQELMFEKLSQKET